jgi:hypothetical protein
MLCVRRHACNCGPSECSIAFDKDALRPALVENSALPCLKEAAKRLKGRPCRKLVLVGVKDPANDHKAAENGSDRERRTRPVLMCAWKISPPTAP